MYVAWIDRLFVDCFGLFHMVLTKRTVDSSESPDVKEREDNNCVRRHTQKQRVK